MHIYFSQGPCTHTDMTLSRSVCICIGVTLPPRSPHTHRRHLVPGSLHTHGHHLVPKVATYTRTSPCPHSHHVHVGITLSQGPCAHTDITLCPQGHNMHIDITLSHDPCTHIGVTLSPWLSPCPRVPAYTWMAPCPRGRYIHGHHVVRGSLRTHGCHLVPGSLHTHGHHLVPKVPMYTQTSPCPHGRYTHTDVTLSQGPPAHMDITLHRHPPPEPCTPPVPPWGQRGAENPPRQPRARPAGHHRLPPPPRGRLAPGPGLGASRGSQPL